MFCAIKTKNNCDGKKLWSLKDLPLVSFVRRQINARAAALMMRAWWQKPFLPKSSNISRTHFSFSGQKQIYRCHDSFPCTWVFIGSTDIFSESSISCKSKIWKENNNISGEHITSDEKNFFQELRAALQIDLPQTVVFHGFSSHFQIQDLCELKIIHLHHST